MTRSKQLLNPWADQNQLDRRSDLRNRPTELAELWRSANARLIRLDERGNFHPDRLVSRPVGDFDPQTAIFLGICDRQAWFTELDSADELPESTKSAENYGVNRELLFAATAILAWHQQTIFCASCGGEYRNDLAGFSKTCTSCNRQEFPRQDPAVIVAVTDEQNRILLGHQRSWKPKYFSLIAGFLEAGETGEQAVVREVFEETNLVVSSCKYLTSQPWPFPRSLMLAYVAKASGKLNLADQELAEARWFSVAELAELSAAGEINIPQNCSVAAKVIKLWLAGGLPDA